MININTTLLWEAINFFVLLWLLKRYLYTPLTDMLDKRKNKIESDIQEAKDKKKEAQELKEKYEKQLSEARSEAQEIVEEAEERAKEKANNIVEEAREDAQRIKERNEAEIEQAKEEAVAELKEEVSSISLMAASKFLREQLDEEKHKKLINQYIENLDEKKLGEAK
ncbi:MAG: F0F1 ATP synthase subunit B [Halanaerobiales bacterium]